MSGGFIRRLKLAKLVQRYPQINAYIRGNIAYIRANYRVYIRDKLTRIRDNSAYIYTHAIIARIYAIIIAYNITVNLGSLDQFGEFEPP